MNDSLYTIFILLVVLSISILTSCSSEHGRNSLRRRSHQQERWLTTDDRHNGTPTDRNSTNASIPPRFTLRPTVQLTARPTVKPSYLPSKRPSRKPSVRPTLVPTKRPSRKPSSRPTLSPSKRPSRKPSSRPTLSPSKRPSRKPSNRPTLSPSQRPSRKPSTAPTLIPTKQPSRRPSVVPTFVPTKRPSRKPSIGPTSPPTKKPTIQPSLKPSRMPSWTPSRRTSLKPTTKPTTKPTNSPSSSPSKTPSHPPTERPTLTSSSLPSPKPTLTPSSRLSKRPTKNPSTRPSTSPTLKLISMPSEQPSFKPSHLPTFFSAPLPTPSKRCSSQDGNFGVTNKDAGNYVLIVPYNYELVSNNTYIQGAKITLKEALANLEIAITNIILQDFFLECITPNTLRLKHARLMKMTSEVLGITADPRDLITDDTCSSITDLVPETSCSVVRGRLTVFIMNPSEKLVLISKILSRIESNMNEGTLLSTPAILKLKYTNDESINKEILFTSSLENMTTDNTSSNHVAIILSSTAALLIIIASVALVRRRHRRKIRYVMDDFSDHSDNIRRGRDSERLGIDPYDPIAIYFSKKYRETKSSENIISETKTENREDFDAFITVRFGSDEQEEADSVSHLTVDSTAEAMQSSNNALTQTEALTNGAQSEKDISLIVQVFTGNLTTESSNCQESVMGARDTDQLECFPLSDESCDDATCEKGDSDGKNVTDVDDIGTITTPEASESTDLNHSHNPITPVESCHDAMFDVDQYYCNINADVQETAVCSLLLDNCPSSPIEPSMDEQDRRNDYEALQYAPNSPISLMTKDTGEENRTTRSPWRTRSLLGRSSYWDPASPSWLYHQSTRLRLEAQNKSEIPLCALCNKEAQIAITYCHCGNPECYKVAHLACLIGEKNPLPSLSYPGTPPPILPPVLCSGGVFRKKKTEAIT